jgi:hypothetical protein
MGSVKPTASIFKVEGSAEQPAKERLTENVAILYFCFLQIPCLAYACSSDLKVETVGSSETSVTPARMHGVRFKNIVVLIVRAMKATDVTHVSSLGIGNGCIDLSSLVCQ